MTLRSLFLNSLFFHRRANLAVLLGAAVGAAVLAGALLLGDSLRGSLRDLTLRRLGAVDVALISDRFFPADLAERLAAAAPAEIERAVPALLMRGSVFTRNAEGRLERQVGQVQIVGVDERFWPLFGMKPRDLGGEVVLNETLAEELRVGPGDAVEARFERPHAVPADSVIGRRDQPEGLLIEERKVSAVLPTAGGAAAAGAFSLAVQQTQPKLLYVQLRLLQDRLARDRGVTPERDATRRAARERSIRTANALLIQARQPLQRTEGTAPLAGALAAAATLEDLGLNLRHAAAGERYLSLESQRMLVEPEVQRRVAESAKQMGWTMVPTFTYLANLTTHERDFPAGIAAALGRLVSSPNPAALSLWGMAGSSYTPYAAVTALDPAAKAPFGPFTLEDGSPARPLQDDEILVGDFVARDLWPAGDWRRDLGKAVVRIGYFVEGEGHQLLERTATLKLAGVVTLAGLAADPSLTPEFPGLSGERIADWKPPFPKSQWRPELIRQPDEDFYRRLKAAPKGFVSPALARKLWASRWGEATSLRLAKAGVPLKDLEAEVRSALREALPPEAVGLTLQPVKLQGLAATQSGTAKMFGGLFVGFSFFLILSAALLVGLLFRLGLERRAREWGLLFALGYPLRTLRRLALGEGVLLAFLGALLGLALAVGYAWLLIRYLRSGWRGAIDSSFLELHLAAADPNLGPLPYPSLSIGMAASLLIAWLTLRWSLRGFAAAAPVSLLGGASNLPAPAAAGWLNQALAWGLLALAALLAGASFAVPPHQAPGLFFGAGFLLLASGLALVRLWLRRKPGAVRADAGARALVRLGAAYASRNVSRSLLTAGLLAAGTFMVVSVQAFRQAPTTDGSKETGIGDFRLVGEADVALPQVPDSPAAWRALAEAIQADDAAPAEMPAGVKVFGFRLRGGDDVSCLNLLEPAQPRILGATPAFLARGGFRFALPADATPAEQANPWRLLERKPGGGAIPLIADDHAAQWVLQKQLGDEWTIQDELGRPAKVRLVGMLLGSMLQSELIMSEGDFRRLFPGVAGYRLFLAEAGAGEADAARKAFDQTFGEAFGLTFTSAAARLASFQAVENTYLSTFQALGGLGLLLGSVGLGVVLMRNLNERRGEWALLRAVGYADRHLTLLALAEQGLLIALGLGVGLAAAFLAIAPFLWRQPGEAHWLGLLGLIALIPLVGLASGLIALRSALAAPLLPALQRE